MPINHHRIRQIIPLLRDIKHIRIPRGRLRARQLHRERRFPLPLNLLIFQIKKKRPIIHILVIRLRTQDILVPAKHTPVDIIEILSDIARADGEDDAVGELGREIVDGPVGPVLLWVQGVVRVEGVDVLEFTVGFIWGARVRCHESLRSRLRGELSSSLRRR